MRRTAHVARLLAESGTIALVSLVSPYAADREAGRRRCTRADELDFVEVFVDAPLELCEKRDPKGLYARARAGELAGLTGVGAPYEPPDDPDLVLGSARRNGRAGGRARDGAALGPRHRCASRGSSCSALAGRPPGRRPPRRRYLRFFVPVRLGARLRRA